MQKIVLLYAYALQVVVDPAGWRYVGKTGEVKGAGGAAGAIYDWSHGITWVGCVDEWSWVPAARRLRNFRGQYGRL